MSNITKNLSAFEYFLDPFLLFGFVIISLGCLLLALFWIFRIQNILKNIRLDNLQLKLLLSNQFDMWVSWWRTEQKMVCSKSFYIKMGIEHNLFPSPKYIKYLFSSFDFKAFFQTVHAKKFYRQECITADNEVFSIYGAAKFIQNDWCYTLWFRNISHQKSKIELHNDIINQLSTERDIMKDILDNVPWPAWYKAPNKKLLFCNQAYADALDVSVDQAVVEQILLKSWQQGGRVPNLTDLVLKTKETQTQTSYLVIKNERNFVKFTETLTDKGFIVGCLHDLSNQEKLQDEIHHLTKSTHEILEVISLPVVIYNSNQQVEFFNNSFLKMFELDAKWLEAKPTFSEVLEELRAKRKIPDIEDFQSYKNRRLGCFNNLLEPIEDIAYYPDGKTVRMITAPYHNGGLIITLNDITDWLTLERQYNTLLAVHRQVADNLFEGLAVFGTDNRLQLYNSAFCRMWHYTEEDLTPPPHLDSVIDKIKAHIDYQHYDSQWENFKKRIRAKIIDRSSKKEGRIKLYDDVVYDYSYTPLPDGSNLLTFLDVSDRYRIEKNLLERSEALEVAHGIKSDFISTIHQGIKYPLRRMLLSFTDIFEQKYGEINLKYQERLKTIWLDIDHILRFIEDANDLASIESGNTSLNKEPLNVIKLIEDVNITLLERVLEKEVHIQFAHDIGESVITADFRRLKQIFFNLLRNAISYAETGENILINLKDTAEELHVEISNSDAIIPYEDAYGASKKLKRGQQLITGLGFSLIKKIVTLHNGRVILNHQKGTKVICVLPKENFADLTKS